MSVIILLGAYSHVPNSRYPDDKGNCWEDVEGCDESSPVAEVPRSLCCRSDKHHDLKQLGEEKVHFHSNFHVTSILEGSQEGSQGRNWSRNRGGKQLIGSFTGYSPNLPF